MIRSRVPSPPDIRAAFADNLWSSEVHRNDLFDACVAENAAKLYARTYHPPVAGRQAQCFEITSMSIASCIPPTEQGE